MDRIHYDFDFVATERENSKRVLLLLAKMAERDTGAAVSNNSEGVLRRVVAGLFRTRDPRERRMVHVSMQDNVNAALNYPSHDRFRIECHAVHPATTRNLAIRNR